MTDALHQHNLQTIERMRQRRERRRVILAEQRAQALAPTTYVTPWLNPGKPTGSALVRRK